jgi:hypothetical protein
MKLYRKKNIVKCLSATYYNKFQYTIQTCRNKTKFIFLDYIIYILDELFEFKLIIVNMEYDR